MLLTYFSDKLIPSIHDVAAKKYSFGIWKEEFIHHDWFRKEEGLKIEMKRFISRKKEEEAKDRKIHAQARSDLILKYSITLRFKILLSEIKMT
jgi:hypothetical protein